MFKQSNLHFSSLSIFLVCLTLLSSCEEVGVINGKAAYHKDNNSMPGIAFKKKDAFVDGYVELDLTGKFENSIEVLILLRSQNFANNYSCRIIDYDHNGKYDLTVSSHRNDDVSIPADRSNIIKYDILSPANFQAGNVTFGCEINKGVLSGYINRQRLVSYTLGSGTENESQSPNLDSPILTSGEAGFSFYTSSEFPISVENNEQIQIDNFRIYHARPF